ncbi:MAG: ribonucleoside-diphosphate reductase subunit alpha [Candidatus Babeliaceae bacterium]|nr:ribonucleoside-diphosphate reductase subunit alpha [Candidatus Babeliaceae bacterium]
MDIQKTVSATGTMTFTSSATVSIVKKRDGRIFSFDRQKIDALLKRASIGYEEIISSELIMHETLRNLFDGISTSDVLKSLILAAVTFIEKDPAYSIVAARLLQQKLFRELGGKVYSEKEYQIRYRHIFIENIVRACKENLLHPKMQDYDLERLSHALILERDALLHYTGMQTLYERYLLRYQGQRYETVQAFWMRIAMGLALDEKDKNARALEFYEILSTLSYVPSTPTLFHSGLPVAQLSSCYLSTVNDDLHHIFKCMGDNAQLSKWAGGIGTDWSNIRGTGAYIKSIKATSQGVVPYLKIANDIVVAITRSGIRRGGKCAYLEVWHIDIEDFLDLRRNTGDDRRRTHDMNTATWIPDLFMKRVINDENWTLFSPHETPDLHHIYGRAFEERYMHYEQQAREGKIDLHQSVPAKQLWRKMLTRLFETGHPWITFKDPCNIRSPQDHAGVVHSSNLCTEITLNTSETETAVCNLGSVNLERLVTEKGLNVQELEKTVTSAIRMLDNVIDLNFYPTKEAESSNKKHRPIGLGVMGFQDALCKMNISFASEKALQFADESMEYISYFAIKASNKLAEERGTYASYKGSKWDRGIFPLDTIDILEKERGMPISVSRTQRLDWISLKESVKSYGLRNSNMMAIAPTATISTIAGCYPCIEPMYKNMYVKSNVSGEFTVINSYLVEDLKKIGLWDQAMIDEIKFRDGDLQQITRIPQEIRQKHLTAFELDAQWMIKITAERGKWIDQSQSHNVFIKGVSGKKLDDVYRAAWNCGLKTTYYLRTLGASQIEKSTLDAKTYGFTQKRSFENDSSEKSCSIENTDCESCQ